MTSKFLFFRGTASNILTLGQLLKDENFYSTSLRLNLHLYSNPQLKSLESTKRLLSNNLLNKNWMAGALV